MSRKNCKASQHNKHLQFYKQVHGTGGKELLVNVTRGDQVKGERVFYFAST